MTSEISSMSIESRPSPSPYSGSSGFTSWGCTSKLRASTISAATSLMRSSKETLAKFSDMGIPWLSMGVRRDGGKNQHGIAATKRKRVGQGSAHGRLATALDHMVYPLAGRVKPAFQVRRGRYGLLAQRQHGGERHQVHAWTWWRSRAAGRPIAK